jgi:hypothetical protein
MIPVRSNVDRERGPVAGCLILAAFLLSEAWSVYSVLAVGFNTSFGDGSERTFLAGLIGLLGCIVLIPAGWAAFLWEGAGARLVTLAASAGIAAIAARATVPGGLDFAAFLLLGLPAWLLLVAVGVRVWWSRSQ